ncbi:MAG: hypothetical protein IAE98_12540 [Candidatus Kapabacteria bacterium]|nr:hypothetical protein [Candidatus Kapabacteria bacterium]
MRKAYIDIDGVILTKRNTLQAEGLHKFLDFLTKSFDCYWLTTHCKGNVKNVLEYLSKFLDDNIMGMISTIKATNWTTLKTEAIDMTNDFQWFDDYPLQAEIEQLKLNGKLDNLIIVNLDNKVELQRVIKAIDFADN